MYVCINKRHYMSIVTHRTKVVGSISVVSYKDYCSLYTILEPFICILTPRDAKHNMFCFYKQYNTMYSLEPIWTVLKMNRKHRFKITVYRNLLRPLGKRERKSNTDVWNICFPRTNFYCKSTKIPWLLYAERISTWYMQ